MPARRPREGDLQARVGVGTSFGTLVQRWVAGFSPEVYHKAVGRDQLIRPDVEESRSVAKVKREEGFALPDVTLVSPLFGAGRSATRERAWGPRPALRAARSSRTQQPEDPMKKRTTKTLEMLPTLLTLGNLFSGFLAIAKLTDSLHSTAAAQRIDLYTQAIWYVFVAMIFDAVDGKVARMFGAASEFGSQIDSLSDVISFGAAPALLFKVMVESEPGVLSPKAALILAVVYLACAALRLARFNVETSPEESSHQRFKGLPSPAAAGCVLSLAFINMHLDPENAHSWVLWSMPWLVPLIGFLMVSRFPYIHLTHALFQDRRPFRFLVLLVFGAALAIWRPEFALPIVVILYVISGPLTWVRHRVQRKTTAKAGPATDDDDEDIL